MSNDEKESLVAELAAQAAYITALEQKLADQEMVISDLHSELSLALEVKNDY